jgi:hypothetical protein
MQRTNAIDMNALTAYGGFGPGYGKSQPASPSALGGYSAAGSTAAMSSYSSAGSTSQYGSGLFKAAGMLYKDADPIGSLFGGRGAYDPHSEQKAYRHCPTCTCDEHGGYGKEVFDAARPTYNAGRPHSSKRTDGSLSDRLN